MKGGTLLSALGEYQYGEQETDDETNPMYTKGFWGWIFLSLTSFLVVWATISGM